MGKKGPLWWRESDWLLRGSSAANQILLRHSGPILSFDHPDKTLGPTGFTDILFFNTAYCCFQLSTKHRDSSVKISHDFAFLFQLKFRLTVFDLVI